ncbi:MULTISPECIES: hypothetical protein [Xenorhabdus]|uniref:hypothetical protein n=1 Tax=Xenorhabdus TaxID=626 RepID=UPI00064AE1A9|nr:MULTISPECIES: hypothetical protein [Xenorhabdus]KLU17127.1 hypothetical protein AAY47_01530 [Xenorhabdus griffiniae]KOP32799.1 hypothetical protein AFK69_13935 [Xenorhabdus sp. GDc328]
MNNELPKVDITYGTTRHGDRSYKGCKIRLNAISNNNQSVKITLIDGSTMVTNFVKINRGGVFVFEDKRIRDYNIAFFEPVDKISVESDTSLPGEKREYFDQKTFHLILKKIHATEKKVAVFMKNGDIYKGKHGSSDLDSFTILIGSRTLTIMYDAIKRIIPLEADGTLAE